MKVERVCRAALLPLWAVWWGGLTFYAAFVVPAGTELFGSVEQGFLTQQATLRLNQLSWCVIALLLVLAIGATRRRRRGASHGDQSARAEKYLWT
ncbi:MAG TPA: hypothetical protein PLV92_22170, partial [Pirellulaceae bacterium]|nr:hypothetical protein [Pirellulaceae bacterium]